MTTLLWLSLHQLRQEERQFLQLKQALSAFLQDYYREVCPELGLTPPPEEQLLQTVTGDWQTYCHMAEAGLTRWYRRLARQCHPDSAGSRAMPRLFAEATDAYRRRDWQHLRELCSLAQLPNDWLKQLTDEAMQALSFLRRLRKSLRDSDEYRLWQHHLQADEFGWHLASLVVERLRNQAAAQ